MYANVRKGGIIMSSTLSERVSNCPPAKSCKPLTSSRMSGYHLKTAFSSGYSSHLRKSAASISVPIKISSYWRLEKNTSA